MRSRDIYHEITNASTPQENRVVEHLNRTILEITRTMIYESSLARNLWPFTVQYTQEILNRLLMQALAEDKIPYEVFYLKKLPMKHLQVFGCQAYIHIPLEGKLGSKSNIEIAEEDAAESPSRELC